MAKREIVIGTRGSPLALYQANKIKDLLIEKDAGLVVKIKKIKTTGDKILDTPLAKVGGKGLFVKEIEEAMLKEEVDIAVHSMKDVPVIFPSGLGLGAYTEREDPRDALISKGGTKLLSLPHGSRIGTSSLRRSTQLLNIRPDLKIMEIRGNVQTRLEKLDNGEMDAVMLAAAGLIRLGLESVITEYLSESLILPAIGQGIIGIEYRLSDTDMSKRLSALNDHASFVCITAERAFLKKLEGGCQVPIGGYAVIDKKGMLNLKGYVGSLDGRNIIRDEITGLLKDAESLGLKLAENMLNNGAREILGEIYGNG